MQTSKSNTQTTFRFVVTFIVMIVLSAGISAAAVTGTWDVDADGLWSDSGNWESANIPSNAGDVAKITYPITEARTITLDIPITLSEIKMGVRSIAYNLRSSEEGKLIMKGVDGNPAVLEQVAGSALSSWQINCGFTLESDVDLRLYAGGYTRFGKFHGDYDVHLNRGGGSQTIYATEDSSEFYGNWHIHAGTLMTAGEPFGNRHEGIREITIYNNATLRNNGNAVILANRRIIIDSTGGTIMPNSRKMALNQNDQLMGSGILTLSDASNFGGNLTLGGVNDDFTGAFIVGTKTSGQTPPGNLVLKENGSVENASMIFIGNNLSSFNIAEKTDGYDVPAGQTISGVGTVYGALKVSSEGAVIRPGSYAHPEIPIVSEALTLTNGLEISNGGTYLWDLAELEDDDSGIAGRNFGQIVVYNESVNLTGGILELNFIKNAEEKDPDSNEEFWKSDHVWTIITSEEEITGRLRVQPRRFERGGFITQVNGDSLQLVYVAGLDSTSIIVR